VTDRTDTDASADLDTSAAAAHTGADTRGFDLFDRDLQQDPHPHYCAMRAQAGVHYIEANGIYLVLTHDLVLEVLRDVATFSSRNHNREPPPAEIRAEYDAMMADALPVPPTMLDNDPPSHTRYRRLVSRAFTPRMVNALRPDIEATCDRLIDQWIDTGTIEFLDAFAVPLPVAVIAKALNVPEERRHDFKRWSDDNIAAIGAKLSPEVYLAAQRGINEMQQFFVGEFERRRVDPTDDLLTDLLHSHVGAADDGSDDEPLSMPELVRVVQMLLVAGNETTTKFLAETLRYLAAEPARWDALQAEPSLIPNAVEEGLRLSAPTQGMYRIVTTDTELGGVAIPKGSKVAIMFASANRDEALFDDPDAFDLQRSNPREHLAFGKGTHFCVGASLSRLEGNVALERLTARLGSVALADTNTYEYQPSFALRGLKRLELHVEPA
jgi:cytochrome P450